MFKKTALFLKDGFPYPTNTWKSEKMLVKMTLTFISLNWQNNIETRLPENFSYVKKIILMFLQNYHFRRENIWLKKRCVPIRVRSYRQDQGCVSAELMGDFEAEKGCRPLKKGHITNFKRENFRGH